MNIIKKRIHYRFTGRVQGVGFRYTAIHAAQALGITGWVYNDYDGSVQMEAQGKPESLIRLIETISHGMFIEIEGIEKKELPLQEHESSFELKDW